jgi:lipoyl(octanoyl) transferase
MNSCLIVDLGLIGFADAFALQKRLVAARKADAIGDVLLLCEHPHVITLGRNGSREHLLASERVLQQKGVQFHATNRGGDITYHGPGQVVAYPVINLGAIRRDVVWYVRMLEEVMIRTCADFGVSAGREPGKTGVWANQCSRRALARRPDAPRPDAAGPAPPEKSEDLTQWTQSSQSAEAEKIGAIGVHISRWVTSHGFAFNVATDLRFFDLIVPCGIPGRAATSLEKVLERRVEVREVTPNLTRHFSEVFGLEMKATSREELFELLQRFEQPLAIPA